MAEPDSVTACIYFDPLTMLSETVWNGEVIVPLSASIFDIPQVWLSEGFPVDVPQLFVSVQVRTC